MLKKFFITLLGSMAAIWLSFFILVLGLFITVAVLLASAFADKTTVSLKDENILLIELKGEIPEREADFNIQEIIMGGGDMEMGESLADITASIRQAAQDNKIKGIVIDCQDASLGIASRSEIIEALGQFKNSGKWIYAYSNNYSQGDYYIASIADKVYLNPVGTLRIAGVGVSTMFFKNLMDKLGVQMQIVKVGSFKSAVEPYIRTDMSEPSKLQTSIFVNQIWQNISTEIAENRGVEVSSINVMADSLSEFWAPERYVERRMVSELKYRSEFDKLLRDRMDLKADDEIPMLSPSQYLAQGSSKNKGKGESHIAVLYAVGDIVDSGQGGIVADKMVPEIQKLIDDDNVAGLVLRVNSGGGSAFASEQIWKALEDFKDTGRPFYVSMGDYAASGGYYISCGADLIFADPSTLTGSIGIFGMIPCAQKLITDKIGINFQTVQSNPNSQFPTLFEAATPSQLDAMQKYVERGYELFTSRVSYGREMPIDSVKAIGGGRVWDGTTAVTIGLVDELGSLNAAVERMAETLGLNAEDAVSYPALDEQWQAILKTFMNLEASDALGTSLQQIRGYKEIADYLRNLDPLQARMEKIVIE